MQGEIPPERGQRRWWLRALTLGLAATVILSPKGHARARSAFTLVTLGDSVLDCGRYNDYGVNPGQLLVRNDDRLFPQFKGRDLSTLGPARLEHRAQDGARVRDLAAQARGLRVAQPAAGLISIGGNDLLAGLVSDASGIAGFARHLEGFLATVSLRPLLIANVYDPTFGDDSRNFLGVDARVARANFEHLNRVIAALAGRYGELVDLHAHFLTGDASWFTRTIEPSLRGASEVRAAFRPALWRVRGGADVRTAR